MKILCLVLYLVGAWRLLLLLLVAMSIAIVQQRLPQRTYTTAPYSPSVASDSAPPAPGR